MLSLLLSSPLCNSLLIAVVTSRRGAEPGPGGSHPIPSHPHPPFSHSDCSAVRACSPACLPVAVQLMFYSMPACCTGPAEQAPQAAYDGTSKHGRAGQPGEARRGEQVSQALPCPVPMKGREGSLMLDWVGWRM